MGKEVSGQLNGICEYIIETYKSRMLEMYMLKVIKRKPFQSSWGRAVASSIKLQITGPLPPGKQLRPIFKSFPGGKKKTKK